MTINRACVILWAALFTAGMWLAMHKPLWNDELCSQKIAIEGGSWQDILVQNLGRKYFLYVYPIYLR